MCATPQYIDLIYMGGTAVCGPLKIISSNPILSYYTSLNTKFGVSSNCPRPQYTDLIYMGGTRLSRPIKIIFGNHM